jgi:hypothetical protein
MGIKTKSDLTTDGTRARKLDKNLSTQTAGIAASNFAATTWDSTKKDSTIDLSGGDLTALKNDASYIGSVHTKVTQTTGKYYWEVTIVSPGSDRGHTGVADSAHDWDTKFVGETLLSYMYYGADGTSCNNNSFAAFGAAYTGGDIIGVALDLDNGAVYFAKNGTWQNSGDPESGATKTGAAYGWTPAGTAYTPALSDQYSGNGGTANFGASAFSYSVPANYTSGFG